MMTAIRASWNIPGACRKKGQEPMQELIDDFSLSLCSFARGARLGLPDRYVAIDADGAQSLSSLGISRVLHVSRLLLVWRVVGTETPHQVTFLYVRKLQFVDFIIDLIAAHGAAFTSV